MRRPARYHTDHFSASSSSESRCKRGLHGRSSSWSSSMRTACKQRFDVPWSSFSSSSSRAPVLCRLNRDQILIDEHLEMVVSAAGTVPIHPFLHFRRASGFPPFVPLIPHPQPSSTVHSVLPTSNAAITGFTLFGLLVAAQDPAARGVRSHLVSRFSLLSFHHAPLSTARPNAAFTGLIPFGLLVLWSWTPLLFVVFSICLFCYLLCCLFVLHRPPTCTPLFSACNPQCRHYRVYPIRPLGVLAQDSAAPCGALPPSICPVKFSARVSKFPPMLPSPHIQSRLYQVLPTRPLGFVVQGSWRVLDYFGC